MDILACPICKSHPLELLVFVEKEEIEDGVLLCSDCGRWYPIIEMIPHMLPDDLRDAAEDKGFLAKWKTKMPEGVLKGGKPFCLD